MKETDRRGFLKALGKTAVAGAVAATVARDGLPQVERRPEKGERFEIYAASTATCMHCDNEMGITDVILGTYAGVENGEHVWLVESALICPQCENRVTRYIAPNVEFVERRKKDE